MTNKTLGHVNNVKNSKHQRIVSSPFLLLPSKQSSSMLSDDNNTVPSNSTTQINIHYNSNSNNTNNVESKSCPEGGNNKFNDYHMDNAGCRNPIKAYAHGIWYQDYDTIDNSVQQQIQYMQQQRQRFQKNNEKNTSNVHPAPALNNRDVSGNLLNSSDCDKVITGEKQQTQSSPANHSKEEKGNNGNTNSNICDIVVIDIENEQLFEGSTSQQPLSSTSAQTVSSSSVRPVLCQYPNNTFQGNMRQQNISNCKSQHDCIGNRVDTEEDSNQDDDDSLASMETLSDNVSIWIDGEKHWISGVDEQTTCSDLIWALVYYQQGQPEQNRDTYSYGQGYFSEKSKDSKDNQINDKNKVNSTTTHFNNCHSSSTTTISNSATNFNQSMPKNTKEVEEDEEQGIFKITQNLTRTFASTTSASNATTKTSCGNESLPSILSDSNAPVSAVPFPPGISNAAQLATEYVIVKQYHHCEEYLDGSTKVLDVLPPRNSEQKKECELLLRRLGPAPMAAYANNNHSSANTPQLSSLISTDKDSGMGSPVGSARSAKFRRRKHKSSQWLSQANTLHPKLSRCTATANERLLKIIMAQDETIQRQLSLLREKERQINKIEEEKHRKRERELGKNYLLETYLNGLDEAECQPQPQDGEEIFIDEPQQQQQSQKLCETLHTSANIISMDILDNFKLKDSKKDKKKKRNKEKLSNTIDAKFSSHGINRTKEKCERILRQHHNNDEITNIPGSIFEEEGILNDKRECTEDVVNNRNKMEIESQIFWLEKVYALNKQLQKEEELAAKLHAKIRKHQLKKTNQTQKEVQLEMDKLDNNLALQCGNIRRVEATLMETNEQLQKKLAILERLSLEYLRQQESEQTEEFATKQQNLENENHAAAVGSYQHHQSLESKEMQKIVMLDNIKSAKEVEELQKLIAKPNCEIQTMETAIPLRNSDTETCGPQMSVVTTLRHCDQPNEEGPLNPVFLTNNESLSAASTIITNAIHTSQAVEGLESKVCIAHGEETTTAMAGSHNTTRPLPAVCVVLDKNMSTSFHVQNAKTIKKQMFHSQAAITTTTTKAAEARTLATSPVQFSATGIAHTKQPMPTALPPAASSTASPAIRQPSGIMAKVTAPPAPPPPPPKPKEMNAFNATITTTPTAPTKQQCPNFNQHMQHPSKSYKQAISSLSCPLVLADLPVWQQQCQAFSSGSAKLAAESSASLTSFHATNMANIALPATTSSPASLMAMNTIDISQLGTLV
ncbi:uncharacterized protein [Musca autumnalis]|uniref:uncharacterized protein n=1 Tax=Musca autumnalis TaxID=221902 RepID=UPI003CE67632